MDIRKRLTYSNVVSTICLFAVLGSGSAVAAVYITGANVKDGSLTGLDIRNKSIAARDLTLGARATFTDTSPWEAIPSGKTVKGGFYERYTIRATSDLHALGMQLPARPPSIYAAADINFSADTFAETTDDSAACTGTHTDPTAPPGKICVYLTWAARVTGITANEFSFNEHRALGLWSIDWADSGAAGEVGALWGTWAYTAP